jgi:cholera toxin transcriptional activator
MTDPQPSRRYRFGIFEADAATGELRRRGIRVKLNTQPFQVLLMLLERPARC